jgi:hypothetical protein
MDLVEQRLEIGLKASQGKKVNGIAIKIHLATNQTVSPGRLNVKATAEKIHLPMVIGTANVDDSSAIERCPITPAPLSRKLRACWGRIDARG